MSRYTSQDVDEIAEAIRSGKDRGRAAHILFGAGCSKAAGIPLAREIVEDIHKKYPNYIRGLPANESKKYGACMKKLAPNERRDLIAGYINSSGLNWAHIAIAQLIKYGFIDRALTVNFDNILARACGLISLYPATYDFATAPTANVNLIVSPAIVHLHGQGHGVVLLNTEDETKAHAEKIMPIMRQTLFDHPLLVIGYSGETDDVLRIVRDHYDGSEHLYWASLADEPSDAIRQLKERLEYFHVLCGANADLFLIELAQKLGCWPPVICADPIGHLIAELAPVIDYPTGGDDELNVLSITRTRLADLQVSEQAQRGAADRAATSLIEGRPEDAVAIHRSEQQAGRGNDALNEIAFSALYSKAYRAVELAVSAREGPEINRLLSEAERKCEEALRIKPDAYEAINNWGRALLTRAQRATDNSKADSFLKAAENKFRDALRINPEYHHARNNLGVVLVTRIMRFSGSLHTEEDLRAAEVAYEEALRIKPNYPEALSNLASVLIRRARRSTDKEEKKRLAKAAEDKCKAALLIKSDFLAALENWAFAILQLAQLAPKPKAATLLSAAESKFREALSLAPDKTYNFACFYALTDRDDECRASLQIAEQGGTLPSADHMANDEDLKSVRGSAWFKEMIARRHASN